MTKAQAIFAVVIKPSRLLMGALTTGWHQLLAGSLWFSHLLPWPRHPSCLCVSELYMKAFKSHSSLSTGCSVVDPLASL